MNIEVVSEEEVKSFEKFGMEKNLDFKFHDVFEHKVDRRFTNVVGEWGSEGVGTEPKEFRDFLNQQIWYYIFENQIEKVVDAHF